MSQTHIFANRYQTSGILGHGGMADVYRGRDLRLERDIAVKVLRADLARDSGFLTRFRREAQNSAALNHPNITSVYDTGDEETPQGILPYIVMEYVAGDTLKDMLARTGPMPINTALDITADICSALQFSHDNNIVHRDIKPGNVMVTPDGTVKVMDFGIARAMAGNAVTMTQTAAVIGTAQYLSPEQARGETVDARSDIYSTGCLLYELITGKPPFTGDNPVSVAYQHVKEDPIPPSEVIPGIPQQLDSIILKAMSKNPENRYQSALDMRNDLVRAKHGGPVSAPKVLSATERTTLLGRHSAPTAVLGSHQETESYTPDNSPRKQRPVALIISLIAVALLIIAGIAFYTLQSGGSNKVAVPGVIGKDQKTAEQTITTAGLKVSTAGRQSTQDQKGQVLEQTPSAGAKVNKNTQVTIVVGTGPNSTTVPSGIVGTTLSQSEIQQKLDEARLVAAFETKASSQAKGTVVDLQPGEGATVADGSTVTVYISEGNLVTVPNVVGKSRSEAESQLQGLGFTVKIKYQVDSSALDTVVTQNPTGGNFDPQKTTVTLWVSTGATPTTSYSSPAPSSPSASTSTTPSTPPATTPTVSSTRRFATRTR